MTNPDAIWIGNDHGGYLLKQALLQHLAARGIPVHDVGCGSAQIVRYPYYAALVAGAVAEGRARRGILICSTGIGMSIIANKFRGVRASLCTSTYMGRMTRAHNDSNLLCLGGRITGDLEAIDILDAWLDTPYDGGRHDISLGLIAEAEQALFREGAWQPEDPMLPAGAGQGGTAMKIGLAIAPEQAAPSAFVVYRDTLETSMSKAAALGYDGVELALSDAAQAEPERIRRALEASGLALPAISTGRVFAERKVWFTHPSEAVRDEAVRTICGLVDVAARFGALVNIGRARGYIHEGETVEAATERFLACMATCARHAARRGVLMVLEPVNRYETNFINSVPQALAMLDRLGEPNVKVMPDVFHMNIEDRSLAGSFRQAGARTGYVHLADSNRLAPGQGHLPFGEILAALADVGYDGWVTAEILPEPDPDTAARAAIEYLRTLLPHSG